MAKTSAHTKSYASVKAMANLAVHNTREWTEDHPAPRYLLAEEHRDPRGNVAIRRDLTPETVIREYLETNRFGKKHGRLHHKAKPLRETVVVCEARHGREDMNRLMYELERELPFRCMYGHLHRDEGRIDQETGRPVFNYHMHIGHTNLVNGELVNPGKEGLRKMQDICADVLGMERGASVQDGKEKRPHLIPREYRRMAREKERAVAAERTQGQAAENTSRELAEQLATRNQEYEGLKNKNQVLSAENVRLRDGLTRSEATRAADEQALERLKNDPDLDLGPGLDTAEDLATRLIETNRQLRKQIQESGRGTPEIYKRLKEIKTADLPIPERLKAMAEYVDELLQGTPAPEELSETASAGPALADEVVAWQAREQAGRKKAEEKVQELETELETAEDLAHHGAETARELREALEQSRQQAEEREKERKAAEEKREAEKKAEREKTIKERDQDWRDHLKKQRDQVAGDIERLALPKTKTMEGAGSYRERVAHLFTDWRAKLLNYVADLKHQLQGQKRRADDLAQRNQEIIEHDMPYRKLTTLMTPDEKAGLDDALDKMTAEREQTRAQAHQQRRDRDRNDPELGR